MAFGEITQFINDNLLAGVNELLAAKLQTFGSVMDRIGFPVLMVLITVLYIFKNRKNAVERGQKGLVYILVGLVLCGVMGALGWIFTNPLGAAVLTFYGAVLSSTVSDSFRAEKHSVAVTGMALTNIIVGLFALIIWAIWLFDLSKNMTWFLLVLGAPVLVYGYGAFGLLSASTGANDKKVKIKNAVCFVISVAAVIGAVIYINANGLVYA
ncbi:MAG: hypothetical protein IJF80_03975 [Clostridia bacterium]|nr:hypothetical protein [Clostridia bacterium]